tara:strand:- start:1336 stop:2511 length:1176 start_codon:yes stop_codon:yes gene_type:complete
MINLHEPNIGREEKRILSKCIDTGWISSSGKYLDKFEKNISKFLNVKYSLGIINGTSALDIAIKIFNFGLDNEIIIPSITFISPVNSILYNRCNPIFMDIDKNLLLDTAKVLRFLKNNTYQKTNKKNKLKFTFNKKTNKRISALIVVHTFGNAVLLDEIYIECKKRNIIIIEDAAEALGVKYKEGRFKGRYAGTIGDIGCISFNGNKIISTGGGGMIISNNKKLYEKSKYLINQAKDDGVLYIHNEVGYNYRMNNLSAAIGVVQLKKLNQFLKYKKNVHNIYLKYLKNNKNFEIMTNPKNIFSNYWLNLLIIKNNKINLNRLISLFQKNNIQVRPLWYPNHLQKMMKNFERYDLRLSNFIHKKILCLPSSSNIKISDQRKIINILNKINEP